jgi:DNA mismatch repair protein MutS
VIDSDFAGLFATPDARTGGLPGAAPVPGYFPDLQLDQLVDAVVAGREEHDLKPAFSARLTDPSAIERRQAVFADLADERLRTALRTFCDGLASSGRQIEAAGRVRHPRQAQRWRLNAVTAYVDAVDAVTAALEGGAASSAGLREWRQWLRGYRADPAFAAMATGARALTAELADLRYTLSISGDSIVASPFADQEDLGAGTLAAFERFVTGEIAPHRLHLHAGAEMNDLHAAILDLVVRLFPEVFDRVARFVEQHATIRHPVIDVVEGELQFAAAWLDFIAPARRAGLPFCIPELGAAGRLEVAATFDVLLAHSLVADGRRPVTNDVRLGEGESVLVVTGPNSGGKTTFARTLGQLYHLAALGLPVPGRFVALHPPDAIRTHFDRGDRAGDLQSRLEEEITRMARMLPSITERSVVVLNEMFSSTTFVDARTMSADVLRAVLDAGAVAVCVTFIDELTTLDPRVVSLVAGIDEHDPAKRTFEVARGRADGEAHALALATRYGLTPDRLRARIEAHA